MVSKAVVLLSGGLDSATALGEAVNEGRACYPIFFLYGQRHSREALGASELVAHYQPDPTASVAPLQTVDLTAALGRQFFKSSLTGVGNLPTDGYSGGVPSTYVPMRNSVFLAIAFAYAEKLEADSIYTGFNVLDYSGYPDCRPMFVSSMEVALNQGSKRFVDRGSSLPATIIRTPLINKTKVEILRRAVELGVPYKLTWSCYAGGSKPCHKCDSCRFRDAAFKEVIGEVES